MFDGYAFVSMVNGGGGWNSFPWLTHIERYVPNNGEWQYSFDVTDSSVPVAVTITIEGEPICPSSDILCQSGWYSWEWTPDLDAELRGPGGNLLATSTCMLGSEFASYGWQETMHIGAPAVGTYTIYVYPFDGSPNNGKGGNFTVDISTGPLDSACSEDDSDGDGTTDGEDGCPNDPGKIVPGICGCGVSDDDSDCYDLPDPHCDSCFKKTCDGVCHPKEVGTPCPDCSSTPPEASCGDYTCDPGEDACGCQDDCGLPAGSETSCTDGLDNNCDGSTDCDDPECKSDPACSTSGCLLKGEICSSDGDCCTGICAGIKCK